MRYYVTSGNLIAYAVESASPQCAAKKAVIQAKPEAIGILIRVSDGSIKELQPNDYVFRTAEILRSLGLSFDHVTEMEEDLDGINRAIDGEDDK